jgi:hypothetical protein
VNAAAFMKLVGTVINGIGTEVLVGISAGLLGRPTGRDR